jgi:hypothetical protein
MAAPLASQDMSSSREDVPCLTLVESEDCFSRGTISVMLEPSEAEIVFTFLSIRTVSQLLARLRYHGQPQKGDKGTLVLRTFVKVSADVGSSGDWLPMGGATHSEWVSSQEGQLATWKSAPCAAEQAGIVLRGNYSSANATVFSDADFALLCMLLTQDEEVRCALIASGKNLSRTELDAGARRDDFWSITVAPRYNDGSQNISEMPFITSLEAVVETQGES